MAVLCRGDLLWNMSCLCVWQILLSTDTVAWAKNYFTDKSNLKWSVLKEFFQQQKIIFFLLLSTSE